MDYYPTGHPDNERGANSVHLSGWVEVNEIKCIRMNGSAETSIRATIYSKNPQQYPRQPQKYPVYFTGTQAEIVAHALSATGTIPKAVVNGRLFQVDGELFVLAQHVQVLDRISTGRLIFPE